MTLASNAVPIEKLDRNGLIACVIAFVMWGGMPLYWHAAQQVPATQIIAHRIVWSAVFVVGGLLLFRGVTWLRDILARPREFALLGLSSILIAVNWGIYIWAVNAGHVVETSLGYFINPLLNVVLGVIVLRERLNPMQWLAVFCAACGVAWLTWQHGSPPWIALGLAISFGAYGLLRKFIVVDAVVGLGIESLYLFLPALAYVLWSESGHGGGFMFGWGWHNDVLLVLSGIITAIPLIAFAFGVRRIPLTVVGLLQYIAPTLQLLCGVLIFHEPFGSNQAIGFGAIWLGLTVFAIDGFIRSRRVAS